MPGCVGTSFLTTASKTFHQQSSFTVANRFRSGALEGFEFSILGGGFLRGFRSHLCFLSLVSHLSLAVCNRKRFTHWPSFLYSNGFSEIVVESGIWVTLLAVRRSSPNCEVLS